MTKKQKRAAFVASMFVVAAAASFFVLSALNSAVAYFYTPSDLAALSAPPEGVIRLGGLVEAGSVSYPNEKAEVHFVIADEASRTRVVFRGILPDLFREGQGVIAQGRITSDGAMEAMEVLAKHDENYMPREVAEALKQQGRWKEGETTP